MLLFTPAWANASATGLLEGLAWAARLVGKRRRAGTIAYSLLGIIMTIRGLVRTEGSWVLR